MIFLHCYFYNYKKNVLDDNYLMLFECLWLCNVKVTHDGDNNMIIEGNGIV